MLLGKSSEGNILHECKALYMYGMHSGGQTHDFVRTTPYQINISRHMTYMYMYPCSVHCTFTVCRLGSRSTYFQHLHTLVSLLCICIVYRPQFVMDVDSKEEYFIELILNRHARKLLTSRSLRELGKFSAHLDFNLSGWLARERYLHIIVGEERDERINL